jgi:hypothetical protein
MGALPRIHFLQQWIALSDSSGKENPHVVSLFRVLQGCVDGRRLTNEGGSLLVLLTLAMQGLAPRRSLPWAFRAPSIRRRQRLGASQSLWGRGTSVAFDGFGS